MHAFDWTECRHLIGGMPGVETSGYYRQSLRDAMPLGINPVPEGRMKIAQGFNLGHSGPAITRIPRDKSRGYYRQSLWDAVSLGINPSRRDE
ncbi:MAG: hypothetical protein D3904_16940 [Candidatus Electrothrix sp. EH2]|nr:hypothetical protein [Candidatus Electrothrix sp. EH2]